MIFIQENALLIVSILLVFIFILISILIIQHKNRLKSKGTNKGGSSKKKHYENTENTEYLAKQYKNENFKLNKKYSKLYDDYKKLNDDYYQIEKKYKKFRDEVEHLKDEIENLKKEISNKDLKIRELTRDNNELSKLQEDDSATISETKTEHSTFNNSKSELKDVPETNDSSNSSRPTYDEVSSVEDKQKEIISKEEQKVDHTKEDLKAISTEEEKNAEPSSEESKVESLKEKTMYASFPRSAGSSSYFSDLSEILEDDSYFEFKVSVSSGKATFKPLDFMKIRNFDPAMVAMRTEGVKPNVASTVLGIEPGNAHVEGKDWIIDNPAKIKLA